MAMLVLIIVLFVLAILSIKLFPNRMFSGNKHDVDN